MEKCIGAVLILAVIFIVSHPANAQVLDKSKFEKSENEFYDQIKEEIKEFNKKGEVEKLDFKLDFSGKDLPKSISEFKYYWHTPPLSQGKTGSCWCYSTTSFFESEIKRIHNKEIKLSEMYTVYWEFVEKARRFVHKRGDSMFEEGSEANAVPRIWKKYGVVPASDYSGLLPDQKYHDHKVMHAEMQSYLLNCVKTNYWDEDAILANIKSILNYYMGEPPLRIEYEEVELTPLEFLYNVTKLELDDYVDILSLKQKPYFQRVEYCVPDNWWFNADYNNVPLDEFMIALKKAIRAGYSMSIGGDTSEPGYDSHVEVALVPTFDIPAKYINEDARQFRFSNKTTTDDHGIHLIGYMEKNGQNWFLIKDSGSGGFNGTNKGYRFYHEDYIKLKMMDFMIHKDAVRDVLEKFSVENSQNQQEIPE